ncbi:SEL1-like repeat protein [Yoonia sp. R2-816]|uniref:SEL1-like repeat protein n=1 Tax=Yoonia sp. R2-816 TaxID=3342638 RepID=UPI00372BC8E5
MGLATFMFGLTSLASLLNQDRRDDVALWLMGAHSETRWSDSFIGLFDAVFGQNHFSVRCFLRSVAATLIAVVLIWLLMGSANTIGLRMQSDTTLGSLLIIGMIVNIAADYVSLLETRWLLGRMPRRVLAQIGVLILDLMISALIIWIAIFGYINSPLHDGEIETFAEILGVFSIFSVFFYSTFLTSVWTWAYIGSTWLMRLATRLRVSYWLDVEGKPIKVLFLLLAGSVGVVTFAGSIAFSSTFVRQQDGVSFADRALCALFKGRVCLDVAELTSAEHAQLDFITLACEGGVTGECLRRGLAVWELDAEAAWRLWYAACEGEDIAACTNLGFLHARGLGTDVNYAEAARLYRQGCDGGHAGGCSYLGQLYQDGLGVDASYRNATRLYQQGCDGGHAWGCTNLGILHDEGLGMDVNYAEAARLYRRACDGGHADGCSFLGYLHRDGLGMAVNYSEAARLYRQGCDGGHAWGCTFLGALHSQGLGMDVDYVKAAELYQRGCDGGHAASCTNLGNLLSVGLGTDVNQTEAALLYRQGCNDGHAISCVNLGSFHQNGVVVDQDLVEAERLYQRGCDLGKAVACDWAEALRRED